MTYRFTAAALIFGAAVFGLVQSGPATAADAPAAKGTTTMPQTDFLAQNLKKPGWKATAKGLQYRVVKSTREGPKPLPGTTVTVHYDGTFIDGRKFDSSYERQEPATFQLGNVIEGWQEGVPMMREGETWEFAIPSAMAYGPEDRGPIAGGSTLLFKVRLLWVANPAPEPPKASPAPKPAPAAAPPAAPAPAAPGAK